MSLAAAASRVEIQPVQVLLQGAMAVTVFEAKDQDAALDAAIDDESDPFGSVCWPSAIASANELVALVQQRGSLEGLKLLELGAGPGLISIAALHLGADVIATDCAPLALRLARSGLDTAARDGARGNFRVQELDIKDDQSFEAASNTADLVISSDMLYEHDLATALGRALRTRRRGAVLVADPGRQDGRQAFLRALDDASARFEDVLVPRSQAHALRIGPTTTDVRIGVLKLGFDDLMMRKVPAAHSEF